MSFLHRKCENPLTERVNRNCGGKGIKNEQLKNIR